jgi:hypothetical protein
MQFLEEDILSIPMHPDFAPAKPRSIPDEDVPTDIPTRKDLDG